MQWVFFVGDQSLSFDCLLKMQFPGNIQIIRNREQLEIRWPDHDYVIFEPFSQAEMQLDFEPEEFEAYLRQIPFSHPKWMMLKYNNIAVLSAILREPDFPADVLIDCDGVNLGLDKILDPGRIIGTEMPKV